MLVLVCPVLEVYALAASLFVLFALALGLPHGVAWASLRASSLQRIAGNGGRGGAKFGR